MPEPRSFFEDEIRAAWGICDDLEAHLAAGETPPDTLLDELRAQTARMSHMVEHHRDEIANGRSAARLAKRINRLASRIEEHD